MGLRSKRGTSAANVTSADLARAARVLSLRSWREATGLFAGNYASAFRGGGIEFEESRPYVVGDDVRTLDWVATARMGEPFVKCFREERNQTLFFALDTSASMAFGTTGLPKAATATHALALLAAAAGRAGDRTGLIAFGDAVHREIPVGRGMAHTWDLIRAAAFAAANASGRTDFSGALRSLLRHTRQHATVVILSDFRGLEAGPQRDGLWPALASLARHRDVVACVVFDPREESLPNSGTIRIQDPERPGRTFLLHSGSARTRERYRVVCAARRQRLDRELRRCGIESLWLRNGQSPLHGLGRFFQERATRRARAMS